MPDSFDFIGRFKSPKSQRQFIRYCIEHQSKFCFVTISALIFSWAIAMSLLGAIFVEKGDPTYHDSLQGYGITTLILGILGVVCSLLTCFPCLNTKDRYLVLSYLQVSVIAFMDLIFIIKSIQKLHLGSPDCTSGVSHQSDITAVNQATAHSPSSLLIKSLPACPSDNSFASLFANRVILAISLCPQLLMAIVHEPRLYFILISQLATSAIVAASMYTSVYSILPYSILSIVTVFLVTELHFQRIRSFITQRRLQQLLEQIEREADENHATEMRHMIGNVAHDLKTPLASFTNGLDIINDILMKAKTKAAENAMTSETFAECFASIQSCIVNIQNTNAFMLMRINRCIDYTKASKGIKLVPKFETVDLHEALQFPIDCMRNIQERIEIKLEPLPEGTCSHIITDKQWLQENILCLLSNAVKYSTEGEVKISTTLIREPLQNNISDEFSRASTGNLSKIIPTNFEEPDTSYLLFEIEDTGIGLSEEAIKSLFNPFKQAQRLAGGTGLGLYSLAKRMKALHGSYGVRKRKDGKQGSLFWFTVPYKPDLTSFTAAKDTTTLFEQSADTTYSSRQCSDKRLLDILIVDDSPSILKTSSFMLKRQGHQIWTAENGEIALKRIEEKWRESGKGFDLVLMDLQMPVMDGLEATRRLRMMEAEGRDWMIYNDPTPQDDKQYEYQAKVSHHQIIIGLSANSDHETANDAIRAGADDFFGKPFSLNTFNKMIERYF